MYKNYLKVALRNIWKYKSTTSVIVIGLALAFGVSLLLILTAYFELSYDQFHTKKDDIYRLYRITRRPDHIERSPIMPAPLQPAIQQAFPEVQHAVRYLDASAVIEYGDKQFDLMVRFVDEDFLNIFSFPLIEGNPESVLSDPGNITLTENTATLLFGNDSPIGKTIRVKQGEYVKELVVSGISRELPKNSTIKYHALTRFENDVDYLSQKDRWDNTYHNLFIQLNEKTSPSAFEKKLVAFTEQHYEEDIDQLRQEGAVPDEQGNFISLHLQPLTDLHFNRSLNESSGGTQIGFATMLLILGILLLLVAAFNFINLNLARYLVRTKEAGIRKVMGAKPKDLITQLTGEALCIGFISILAGGFLFYDLIPVYNSYFNQSLSVGQFQHPFIWVTLGVGFILLIVLAGTYPAFWLSRINILESLAGKLKISSTSGIRNILIIFQFGVACLLIACTMTTWRQIQYLRNKPLGFNKEQVLSIPIGQGTNSDKVIERMRQELSLNPKILNISAVDDNIGRGLDGSSMVSKMGFVHEGRSILTHWLQTDYDYIETMDIELLQGRGFDRKYASDSARSLIINRAMAEQLGNENVLGTTLQIDDDKDMEVIGIVENYHFESLHSQIEPITMTLTRSWPLEYLYVRVQPESLAETVSQIKNAWEQIVPQTPFEASFLDENTDRLYQNEQRLAKIFLSAAFITILISCMGLFAIALMDIRLRKKEIGIRKILGATVSSIFMLISSRFLRLVFVSLILSIPIAWYAMNRWMEGFAYRAEFPWWIFIITAATAVLIAQLTVGVQSIRAAQANPVDAIKDE